MRISVFERAKGGAAIVGALLAGIVMYAAAGSMTEALRSWLVHLPGIHSSLLQRVQLQLAEHGLGALLVGPALGIPYKIYAVEWGARHGNCALFL